MLKSKKDLLWIQAMAGIGDLITLGTLPLSLCAPASWAGTTPAPQPSFLPLLQHCWGLQLGPHGKGEGQYPQARTLQV